jgi:hypothetical protein
MKTSDRNREPDKPKLAELPMDGNSATATVERELYVDFAKWLDLDLARLETLYKDWATAGYGQWRRSIEGQSFEGRR